jgi:hypothetical protein
MANLLGQNIGTNYKGILSLDSTINTPLDATLRAVTDGEGNASGLKLSTTDSSFSGKLGVGTDAAPSASLQIQGDGTNDIARFFNADPIKTVFISNRGEIGAKSEFAGDGGFVGYNGNFGVQVFALKRNSVGGLAVQSLSNIGFSVNGANSVSSYEMELTDTGNLIIGGSSGTARLAVKGSGTTAATTSLLVQDSAGTESFKILDNGAAFIRTSLQLSSGVTFSTNTNAFAIGTTLGNVTGNVGTLPVYTFGMASDTSTSNTSNYFSISKTISPSAGSANFRNLIVDYTINASGVQTGTATGIFLNATETALNGMVHNLMDLQVGGVSKLTVTNAGATIISGTVTSDGGFRSIAYFDSFQRVALNNGLNTNPQNYLISGGVGRILLIDNSEADFNRLQFGGTTSSFPSLKRNGTAIDVRLADDSNYALLNTGATFIKGSGTTAATTALLVQNSAGTQIFKVADSGSVQIGLSSGINWLFNSNVLSSSQYAYIAGNNGVILTNGNFSGGIFGNDNGGKVADSGISTPQVASSVLEVSSTTKGFLPPRMTTTQKNAIATPASGLIVYDETTNKLTCYNGTTWNDLF